MLRTHRWSWVQKSSAPGSLKLTADAYVTSQAYSGKEAGLQNPQRKAHRIQILRGWKFEEFARKWIMWILLRCMRRWDFFPLQKLWNILWDDWALAQLNFIVCGHVWICSPEVAITRFPVTLSIPFSVWLYPCQNHLECLMKMQIPGPASCI